MTLEPAKRLDLENRKGVIKVGADADITVFDPETITEVFLYFYIQKVLLYKKSAFSLKMLKIQQCMVL